MHMHRAVNLSLYKVKSHYIGKTAGRFMAALDTRRKRTRLIQAPSGELEGKPDMKWNTLLIILLAD